MAARRNAGKPAPAGIAGAQSIRRAVSILRLLAVGQEHGVRLTDIVEESGLNRPTVHRILRVLTEEGAVEQDAESRRYMIGQEVSLLGLARSARFPIRAVADPYLQYICEHAGDTVFLTIRNGFDSICVDRKTGNYPVKVLSIEVGARRPLGMGVGGLVLLAFLAEDEATAIIKANEQRLARHKLAPARLIERVRQTRSRGYAYSDVGVVPGTRAIAVPVLDAAGEPVAAISIAATTERLPAARVAMLVGLMKEQAGLISRRLVEISRAQARAKR
jgi:DNA-binding IclR family transcriptional regulator